MNAISSQLIDDVCTQLKENVAKVLDTMFSLKAVALEDVPTHPSGDPVVAGSVGFIGEVNGIVYTQVTAGFAQEMASRMLGLPKSKVDNDEVVNDVVGELSNMLVGSVKSRLCDNGSSCVLTIPSIVRGNNFVVQPAGGSERRLMGFMCGSEFIQVEVLMKPGAQN